jgi:hypothetical protein
MTSLDSQLQQRIDQLLMETGEYSPLELLFAEGRLMYTDYQAWMNGETDYLEDALFGDPEHIKAMLQQAQSYVSKLPMLSAHRSSTRSHSFSRNPALETTFNTVYRKAEDQPQMDLFVDGGAGNLINGITLALSQNDFAEARRLLEQLYDVQPDNAKLADLETLVTFGEQPLGAKRDIAGELDYLQNYLTALAQAHLAQHARGYLVQQWWRLTDLLKEHAFDPEQPTLHASFTAIYAMDWRQVKQSIEKEAQWRNHPVLLLRHVQACSRLRQSAQAILSWFCLCWQFPQHADIDAAQADQDLKNAWLDFLEMEPELPAEAFPAWHLFNKPGLAKTLPKHDDVLDNELYEIIQRLLQSRQSNDTSQEMVLRQQIKTQYPEFFQHLIKHVGSK